MSDHGATATAAAASTLGLPLPSPAADASALNRFLMPGAGHRHHARSFRGEEVFGCAGDGGQLTAINQAIKQESVFITEEQGRTIEHTEKQGFRRFAQEFDQTSREAQQLAYSVDSIVLPCFSVIETLT
jgi:hypothetical protein